MNKIAESDAIAEQYIYANIVFKGTIKSRSTDILSLSSLSLSLFDNMLQ